MVRRKIIRIRPSLYGLLACLILLLPIKWIVAWFFAVLVHELFHYIAIRACGGQVYQVILGVRGAEMAVDHLNAWKECISAAAGPVGSFLLVLLAKYMPLVALFGFCHGLYNLLPIYPMDGGRIMRCLFSENLKGNRYIAIIEWSVAVAVAVGGVYWAYRLHLGVLPIILVCCIFAHPLKNFLANRDLRRYNRNNSTERGYCNDRCVKQNSAYSSEAGPLYRR